MYMCGVQHVAAKLLCLLADSELTRLIISIAVSSVPLRLCKPSRCQTLSWYSSFMSNYLTAIQSIASRLRFAQRVSPTRMVKVTLRGCSHSWTSSYDPSTVTSCQCCSCSLERVAGRGSGNISEEEHGEVNCLRCCLEGNSFTRRASRQLHQSLAEISFCVRIN
jgi:hypothetical protein